MPKIKAIQKAKKGLRLGDRRKTVFLPGQHINRTLIRKAVNAVAKGSGSLDHLSLLGLRVLFELGRSRVSPLAAALL